jgi:hypothetical protein
VLFARCKYKLTDQHTTEFYQLSEGFNFPEVINEKRSFLDDDDDDNNCGGGGDDENDDDRYSNEISYS